LRLPAAGFSRREGGRAPGGQGHFWRRAELRALRVGGPAFAARRVRGTRAGAGRDVVPLHQKGQRDERALLSACAGRSGRSGRRPAPESPKGLERRTVKHDANRSSSSFSADGGQSIGGNPQGQPRVGLPPDRGNGRQQPPLRGRRQCSFPETAAHAIDVAPTSPPAPDQPLSTSRVRKADVSTGSRAETKLPVRENSTSMGGAHGGCWCSGRARKRALGSMLG
jgi:hypothetical protein